MNIKKASGKVLYLSVITLLVVVIIILSSLLFKDTYIKEKTITKNLSNSKIVAVADNKNIYDKEIVSYLKNLKKDTNDINIEDIDKKILENIVTEIAVSRKLLEQAYKKNIDKDAEILKKVKFYKDQLIKSSYLDKSLDKEITEDMLHEHYNNIVSALDGQKEINTQHILVKTEAEALGILSELKKDPSSFGELAKKYSVDYSNASKNGIIGYIKKGDSVKEFEDALFALSENKISDPVKTSFGWHIIKANDIRPITILSYNESKENIKKDLKQNLLNNNIKKLIKDINIRFE